jgi:hypothetical protein
MTSADKRRHIRIDSLNLSHITVTEEGQVVYQGMGRTLNVSESGILLETKYQIPAGDKLIISIGLEDDLMELNGKTVFGKETDPGMHETGIEFIEVEDTVLPKLRAFIQAFQS